MVRLRGEEQWAAGCVRAALLGVTVGQHDDNTAPSVHDLDLSVGGSRTFGAMEVTSAVDAKLIAGWKLLPGLGERWIVDGLVGGWDISLRPNAPIKRLRPELPPLLQALERVEAPLSSQVAGAELTVKAAELGVVWARQGGTDFPGSIYVTLEIPPDRSGGVVASTGDALSEWVSEWMLDPSRSDNLEKLQRSAAPERHLFVIVPGFVTTAPFSVTDLLMRTDAPLPTVRPSLPPEVTHVWVMGTWVNGHGFRWSPEHGWEKFANDAALDPSRLVGCTCREANV